MARGKRATRGRGRGAGKAKSAEVEDPALSNNMADQEAEVEGKNGSDVEEFETEDGEGELNDDALLEGTTDDMNNDGDEGDEAALLQEEETPMEVSDATSADENKESEKPAATTAAQEKTKSQTKETAKQEKTEAAKEEKTEAAKEEKTEAQTAAEEKKDADGDTKKDKEEKKEGKEEADEKKKERRKKKERTRSYELEKYWKAVRNNSGDFTGWTYLLQYVEQEDYMPFYREAYDAFFEHYPYCYGYWKKYADCEKKKGTIEKCWEVFNRGLKAIPLSTDLWLHFISVKAATIPKTDEDKADQLREFYEQAIAAAGMDFRSDKLWDQYINFEKKEQKDWRRVMQLYDRILNIPTQLYRHHFDKFKEFVMAHLPKELLDFDEFINLRTEVVAEAPPTEADDEETAPGEDGPPGDEAPPGEEAPTSSKAIEGENKLIQEKVIESRRAIFRKTEQEVSKRWAYEEAIRRPYFHAKPLEKGQLRTWREYLDFEESTGNHDRVVLLYERCLIACAMYEEFWIRYARYMENTSKEAASEIFRRACNVHLPNKSAIHIQWASFEEKHGNSDLAKEILEKLETKQPDSVMIRLERINFERRHGNNDEVINLYSTCINDAKTATGQSFFAGKLARFYQKVLGEHDKAMETLKNVLEQKQVSPMLREQVFCQMLDIEYQRTPVDEGKMVELFDTVAASNLGTDIKILFAQRKVQFLQDFGMNPALTHDAVEEHQKLVKSLTTTKKRSADASGDSATTATTPTSSSDPKKRKKSTEKTNSTSTSQSTQGYTQGTYNTSSYNYGATGATGAAGATGGWSGYQQTQQQQGQQAQAQGGGYNNYGAAPQSWSSWGSYFQQQ